MNLPYYTMGKARLRIAPFHDHWVWVDPDSDPFSRFENQYGTINAEVGDVEEQWYNWLARVLSSDPFSVDQALSLCPRSLLTVATACAEEFVSRWPEIEAELKHKSEAALPADALQQAVCANERMFGMAYPLDKHLRFFVSLFHTLASQQPGPHFVLGAALLDDRDHLLFIINHESAIALLEPVCEEERVADVLPIVNEITRHDRDVRGKGALLEAVVHTVHTHEQGGSDIERHRKPQAEGYGQLLESLRRHRHLLQQGITEFVVESVAALRWS